MRSFEEVRKRSSVKSMAQFTNDVTDARMFGQKENKLELGQKSGASFHYSSIKKHWVEHLKL